MGIKPARNLVVRKIILEICAFLNGLALGTVALAQGYPAKPIHLLFGQAPGSTTDVVSRVLGNRMGESLGQPVIVEARPGAGGALGTELAAKSAPDGYTLFMANNSTHGSNPAIYANLPYDPVRDFAPISFIASVPYVLVVNPTLQVNSASQLVSFIKSRNGNVNYASAGVGSTHHFSAELLKSMAGLQMTHVPYKGSAPAIAALLSGEVSLMFANAADIGPQIKAGKVKPLAVTVLKRSDQLPDVPTLAEQGFAGFEVQSWFGLLAPAGLPQALVTRLNAETRKGLGAADVKSTLGAQGLEIAPGTPEQFGDFIKSEIARFTRIAKTAGIKAE